MTKGRKIYLRQGDAMTEITKAAVYFMFAIGVVLGKEAWPWVFAALYLAVVGLNVADRWMDR